MDQKQIDSFLAIFELGNVTLAARQLNISQPAVTRRIKKLEEIFGIQLFQKHGRNIQPTPEARAILPELMDASKALQNISLKSRKMIGTESGELTVGATPQLIETVLAEFLPKFSYEFPEISVQLLEGGGVELQERILNREIAVGITAEPGVERGLRIKHLWHLDLLAVGTNLNYNSTKKISVKSLAKHKLLVLNHHFQSRIVLESAFRLEGLQPTIAFESSSTHTLVALAQSGLGTAIVPSTAKYKPHALRITQGTKSVQFGIGAIWHGRNDNSAPMEKFVESLEKYLANPKI